MLIEKKLVVSPFKYGSILMFNPAAFREDEKIYLWARTMYLNSKTYYVSYITLLESKDGVNFQYRDIKVYPSTSYDKYGCEDPRIVKINDKLYMTYVSLKYGAWSGTSNTSLIEINDIYDPFSYKKLGVITWKYVDDKDVVIFSEKINGKYWIIHRPNITWNTVKIEDGKIYVKFGKFGYKPFSKMLDYIPDKQSIWISASDSLKIGDSQVLYEPKEDWENLKVGAGTPPIKITEGWLLIYHGVELRNNIRIYRAGALLLDKKNPTKIIGQYGPILEPTEVWEKYGETNYVVFPTGAFILNNELWVYYGAADMRIGLARFDLDKLINKLL